MRYLLLSDIHANLQALEAVLADATTRGFDGTIVLGDLVGYGADPSGVLQEVQALAPLGMVRGNHDRVCATPGGARAFNDVARASIEWTARQLTSSEMQTLASLPQGPLRLTLAAPQSSDSTGTFEPVEICHGAPFNEDFYVFDEYDAARAMDAASARLCFIGHTHVQRFFAEWGAPPPELTSDEDIVLPSQGRLLINVGSVGQPRDGDPRAAYGILDTGTGQISLLRVAYDIAAAQARIRNAGLPERLAMRLERGH